MVKESNFFYRLLDGYENGVSQLLCNLLKIKFFRDICLNFFGIKEDIYKNIQSDNIFPQYNIEGVGIIDICIKNNKTLIFIENKIRNTTKLQESQTTKYVDFVKNNNGKYIFLIPNDDYPQEEIEKIKKCNEPHDFIKIMTWEKFLTHLSELEIEKCSLIIKESLEYLKELILGIPVDLTLTNYEVAFMYNPKDIYNVLSLLDKNYKLIAKVNETMLKELNDKHGNKFTYGKYFWKDMELRGMGLRYNNFECIFWGVNLDLREIYNGDYSYCLSLWTEYLNNNYEKIFPKNNEKYPYLKGDDNWIHIKIDRNLFIDGKEEDLKKRVIEIINEFFLENRNKEKLLE